MYGEAIVFFTKQRVWVFQPIRTSQFIHQTTDVRGDLFSFTERCVLSLLPMNTSQLTSCSKSPKSGRENMATDRKTGVFQTTNNFLIKTKRCTLTDRERWQQQTNEASYCHLNAESLAWSYIPPINTKQLADQIESLCRQTWGWVPAQSEPLFKLNVSMAWRG